MNFISAVKSAKEGKRVYRKIRGFGEFGKDTYVNLFVKSGLVLIFKVREYRENNIIEIEDVLSEDWEVEG
jgi:hypothetical protein